MRFGLVVDEEPDGFAGLRAAAADAEAAGLDLLWLPERQGDDGGWVAPLVAAAALGPVTGALRVGVEVDLGAVNPLHVAEDAIVADLALGGRLVLGVRPSSDRFGEAVTLLLHALAPRPFAFAGPTWPTPAHREGNTFNLEDRLRVTPTPAQLELPVWVVGAPEVAAAHGLTLVARDGERGDDGAALRLRRPALRVLPTDFDAAALVEALHAEQRGWGLDTVLLRLEGPSRAAALARVGSRVRPRVQMDRLPDGLVEHWDSTLPHQPNVR